MDPISGALSVAGNMISSVGTSMGPNSTTSVSVNPHQTLHNICIEWNQNVTVQDFLPELQNQLRAHDIDSKVYDRGMAPSECEAVLYYTVQMQWGTPSFQDTQQSYINGINLQIKSRGQMMATATVGMNDVDTQNHWAPTGKKLAPLIDGIFGKAGQPQPQTPEAQAAQDAKRKEAQAKKASSPYTMQLPAWLAPSSPDSKVTFTKN